MNVLIAGRTKMHGTSRCIGGILDDGTPVRLLRPGGHHWDTGAAFQIGQIWDLTFTAAETRPPLHTEDVIVTNANLVGAEPNLRERLLALGHPWAGSITDVFDSVLGFTGNRNGYISEQRGVPDHSTGFWIPDRELTLRDDGRHYDYVRGFFRGGLTYVGEPQAAPSIPAGTLVRVSLAGWWKPDDADVEKRCYLQLSGWL